MSHANMYKELKNGKRILRLPFRFIAAPVCCNVGASPPLQKRLCVIPHSLKSLSDVHGFAERALEAFGMLEDVLEYLDAL